MRRVLLVTGWVVLLAGCGVDADVSLGAFTNTPEFVPVEAPAGEQVVLRHETGLEYMLTAETEGLPTPVLWDGSWEVRYGDGRRSTFTVGSAAIGDESFDACWESREDDLAGNEIVVCLQSVAIRTGKRPYAETHRELEAALARREEAVSNSMTDWYCFLAGEMIAAGAVLRDQDEVAMLRDHSSHCSFSLLHGTYMAQVAPGVDLRAICKYHSEFPLAEMDHVSQCWNGIGIGLARLYRFDADAIFRECRLAPEIGALKNCFEGGLNYFYNYPLRTGPADWVPPRVDAAWCASRMPDLLGSKEFQEVCYRVAVRGLLESTDDVFEPAEEFAATCRRLAVPSRDACMVAAGSLAARLVIDYRRPLFVVQDAPAICRVREATFDEPCLVRLFSGLLATPQNPFGFATAELLPRVPEMHRQAVAEHFERWLPSIAGVGESAGTGS